MNTENRLALPVATLAALFAIGLVVITCLLLFTGCTIHVIYDPATGHPVARSITPWAPWFNNQATLQNLALVSETNRFRMGVKGVATSQTADTNVLRVVEKGFDTLNTLGSKLP